MTSIRVNMSPDFVFDHADALARCEETRRQVSESQAVMADIQHNKAGPAAVAGQALASRSPTGFPEIAGQSVKPGLERPTAATDPLRRPPAARRC